MRKNKDEEFVYKMTQKEYDAGLAKGWDADDMLSVGTHKFRRSRFADKLKKSTSKNSNAEEAAPNPANCKVKVSMYLDADILQYFRARAEKEHAAPYQTQINHELRRVMENGSQESKGFDKDILNDKEFLRALKEKLETV